MARSDTHAKTLIRGSRVLESLFEGGFQAKRHLDIAAETGIPIQTVWRLLQTWKAAGWVVEVPVTGTKGTCWKLSTKIVGIAHAYERHALEKVQAVRAEYLNITGKELTL